MKRLRNIIKEVINEILDTPEVPKDIEIVNGSNSFYYKFKTQAKEYCVSFKKYDKFNKELGLTKDERVNNIIINSNSVFYLSWGLFDEKNQSMPIDDVKTGAREEVYVFNSVFGIIKEFLEKNNPDAIFYDAIEKRKGIYDKMFNKMNLNYIKLHGVKNTFLIKKDLL